MLSYAIVGYSQEGMQLKQFRKRVLHVSAQELATSVNENSIKTIEFLYYCMRQLHDS